MFHPNLGRWLQNDPIEFRGGDADWYRYEANGPAAGLDPSGLDGYSYRLDVEQRGTGVSIFYVEKGPFGDISGSKTYLAVLKIIDGELYAYRSGKYMTVAKLEAAADSLWRNQNTDWHKYFQEYGWDPDDSSGYSLGQKAGTWYSKPSNWANGASQAQVLTIEAIMWQATAALNVSATTHSLDAFKGVFAKASKGGLTAQKLKALLGHGEYVVADATKAAKALKDAKDYYFKHLGKAARIEYTESVACGNIDTITGKIRINPAYLGQHKHLHDALLLEELLHFRQIRERNWFRPLTAAESKLLEDEVASMILQSGFKPFAGR